MTPTIKPELLNKRGEFVYRGAFNIIAARLSYVETSY